MQSKKLLILIPLVIIAIGIALTLKLHISLDLKRHLTLDWNGSDGEIMVQSPTVYTRERLVNDRFREAAWLEHQLIRDSSEFKKPVAVSKNISNTVTESNIGVVAQSKQATGDKAQNTRTEDYSEPDAEKTKDPSFSPLETFNDELDFRSRVRNEIMGVQLDDRHDIHGNTLYRLNFDTTILPSEYTKKTAKVNVIISEKPRTENIKNSICEKNSSPCLQYETIYSEWQEELQSQINDIMDNRIRNINSRISEAGDIFGSFEQILFESFIRDKICSSIAESYKNTVNDHNVNSETCGDKNSNFTKSVAKAIAIYVENYSKAADIKQTSEFSVFDDFCKTSKSYNDSTQTNLVVYQSRLNKKTHQPEIYNIKPFNPNGSVIKFGYKLFNCNMPITKPNPIHAMISMYSDISNVDKKISSYLPKQFSLDDYPVLIEQFADPYWPIIILSRPTKGANNNEEINYLYSKIYEDKKIKFLDVLHKPELERKNGPDHNPALDGRIVAEFYEAKLNNKLDTYKNIKLIKSKEPTFSEHYDISLFDFKPKARNCNIEGCDIYLKNSNFGHQKSYEDNNSNDKNKTPISLSDFFDTEIQGCNSGRCKLILKPKSEGVEKLYAELHKNIQAFSYSISPQKEAQRISILNKDKERLKFAFDAAVHHKGSDLSGILDKLSAVEKEIDLMESYPVVLGFSDKDKKQLSDEFQITSNEDQATRFGWIIRPQLTVASNSTTQTEFRQIPSHHSLSAVISVPSWWKSISVEIRNCWRDDNFYQTFCDPDSDTSTIYYVKLPGSTAEILSKLGFEVIKAPRVINYPGEPESENAIQKLEAGRENKVLLTGLRLWRSTVVLLGANRASSIEVLPDMKAIVATFECVYPPPGKKFEYYYYSNPKGIPKPESSRDDNVDYDLAPGYIRLWTSEGEVKPVPVKIKPFVERFPGDKPCYIHNNEKWPESDLSASLQQEGILPSAPKQ